MTRIFIEMGVLIMVLTCAAPQSFADGRQQARAMGDRMRGGNQDLAEARIGIPVRTQQGEEIGQVVALATRDSEVAYFLVAMNGGKGELTPIPFSAARFDPQTNAVVLLDVEDSDPVQAPTFSLEGMQRPDNPEVQRPFHGYYGQEPRQQEESGNGMNPEEGMGSQERNRVNT